MFTPKDSYKSGPKSKSLENAKATVTTLPKTPQVPNANVASTRDGLQRNTRIAATTYQVAGTSHQAAGTKPSLVGSTRRSSPLATSTGSIPLFTIDFETRDDEGEMLAKIFVTVLGADPLRNLDMVFYAVSDVEPIHLMYGGREMYHVRFQTLSGAFRAGVFVPKDDRVTVTAKSSALNGAWTQLFKARRIDGRWEWRSATFNDNPRTTSPRLHMLRDTSSAGYPLDERRRPILPVLPTDIGQVTARAGSTSNDRLSLGQIGAERSVQPDRRTFASHRPLEDRLEVYVPREHQIEANRSILCELDRTENGSQLSCEDPESLAGRREGLVISQRGGWLTPLGIPPFRPTVRGYPRLPTLVKPPYFFRVR
jgi:hypothetical protein